MAKRYNCGVEIAFSGGSISLGIDELEVAALHEPWLRFPVVCPRCRREELSALPVAGIAAALLNGSAIPLHVSCHDIYWHASLIEIEQLREYLIVVGIGIERVAEANHPSMEASSMPLDKTGFAQGIVSLERYGVTYTGQWVTTGNRISVYWNSQEDSCLLGMFQKQPENLARMLLLDLVKRELTKHEIDAPTDVAVQHE